MTDPTRGTHRPGDREQIRRARRHHQAIVLRFYLDLPDPEIDEPTAALDPEAEQLLFDAYRRAARTVGADGAVTVLVSHRFSSVKLADRIVVLDGGTVVESGTHQELLAADGRYAALYRNQADAYA